MSERRSQVAGLDGTILVRGLTAANGLDPICEVVPACLTSRPRLTFLAHEDLVCIVVLDYQVALGSVEDVPHRCATLGVGRPGANLKLDHLAFVRIQIARRKNFRSFL